MKHIVQRATLANNHASSLQMQLALARWQGQSELMPQHRWHRCVQDSLTKWLQAGGFSGAAPATPAAQTKTAAKGRRSLVSQRDSDEEFQFTLTRIYDAAE